MQKSHRYSKLRSIIVARELRRLLKPEQGKNCPFGNRSTRTYSRPEVVALQLVLKSLYRYYGLKGTTIESHQKED
jgi:hypothetical protein